MRPRHARRRHERTAANAAQAGMTVDQWLGLSRRERKVLKASARLRDVIGAARDELHLAVASCGDDDDGGEP